MVSLKNVKSKSPFSEIQWQLLRFIARTGKCAPEVFRISYKYLDVNASRIILTFQRSMNGFKVEIDLRFAKEVTLFTQHALCVVTFITLCNMYT